MSATAHPALLRQPFHATADGPAVAAFAQRELQLLLAQDGSATRLCEVVAAGAVALQLLDQQIVGRVPAEVGERLPGSRFIERITCLHAHGEVMMDNLSYIALDGLAADVRRELEEGVTPIGHLLARMWVRRAFFDAPPPALCERLWGVVGLPDAGATRSYCITTPEGPCMLITETFRRGMRMAPARQA